MTKIFKLVHNKNEKREELNKLKKARILLGLLLIMALVAFSGCGRNNTNTIDPDTPRVTTDGGIVNDDNDNNSNNDDGIMNDNDKNNNGIKDDDNNLITTTDGSIKAKDNTGNNQ